MGKNKGLHFNLTKRQTLENLLNQGCLASSIGQTLMMDPTSISREIKHYRILIKSSDKLSICSSCLHHNSCSLHFRCGRRVCNHLCDGCKFLKTCDAYQPYPCCHLNRYPYVCNSCSREHYCELERFIYHAELADKAAHTSLVSSRVGFNLTQDQYDILNHQMFEALVNKRQSVHHFVKSMNAANFPSEKTVYRYIDSGYFSTRNHHLPKKVTLKPRFKPVSSYQYPENKAIVRTGHLLKDWLVFQRKHAIIDYWEMDFLGKPHASSKEVLVLTIPVISFTLLYLLEDSSAAKVQALFDTIQQNLGTPLFKRVFAAILTDRDCKFNDFLSVEFGVDGENRTHLFYCNPGASNEKPHVENYNSQLRWPIPKKAILNDRVQDDLDFLASNMNARMLSSIDDTTPYDLFCQIYGKETLDKLHITFIAPKEVTLKPLHR